MDLANLNDTCPGNLQGVSRYLFLALITNFVDSKCKLGSIQQYNENYASYLQDGDEFDFIVIGSGSGGSVVANKLSENPNWKILVIEAGGYPSATSDIPALLFTLQGTDEDWQYKTEPSETSCFGFKNEQCRWPRGKALGGSSVLNVMLYIKGNKRDYDRWEQMGNVGWGWDIVQHHFKQLENVQHPNVSSKYGREGFMTLTKYSMGLPVMNAIRETLKEQDFPILQEENPTNPLGTLETFVCINNGMRYNTGKAFLGTVKNRPNLYTTLHSLVEKIIIDPETKTATGVQIRIEDKILTVKSKKEVIVSAGTINSPQLLMLSGIGPRHVLERLDIEVIQDLPVGANLQDHFLNMGFFITFNPDGGIAENTMDLLSQYFLYQQGTLATVGTTNIWAFINTKNDSEYPNVQHHFIFHPANDKFPTNSLMNAMGVKDEILQSLLDVSNNTPGLSICATLLNPKSTGKILLRSKNPEDKPIIHSGYLTEGEDLEVMLESIRFMENVLDSPILQKYNPKIEKLHLPACHQYVFRSDNFWKCTLRYLGTSCFHPVGTCKMGPEGDPTAVVDSKLKVHGIHRLRVVDASIMPKIVSGNTHAPTMMIGHKAGVMISDEWSNE
ncbi:glucose dehydrogenase [FAD, quinone]-like [Diorhabda carinulata]|uniref:glucose dehydrogenase [FAD, quinone]-like n=1 Tax=Diorhabda carinulata TaxID=1163345 RepID=UPI0025A29DFB|nr:glucose dehydrogenase [FAD, quinone]-like [Diorhabda carinulata]